MTDRKKGIAYGVGVGPGDPGLMTLKACDLIRTNEVIAIPARRPQRSVAYRIAASAVPELADKELLAVGMPMVKDPGLLESARREAAAQIESCLEEGRNVVFLTLGDVTVYCTFTCIQHILEEDGYEVELVPGVPSFCAAAAGLGTSLAKGDEILHIIPALHRTEGELKWPGRYVLMKSASRMREVKAMLRRSGLEAKAIENCGMENEKVYRSIDEIPDDAGYFSLIIAEEKKEKGGCDE